MPGALYPWAYIGAYIRGIYFQGLYPGSGVGSKDNHYQGGGVGSQDGQSGGVGS